MCSLLADSKSDAFFGAFLVLEEKQSLFHSFNYRIECTRNNPWFSIEDHPTENIMRQPRKPELIKGIYFCALCIDFFETELL
jgi:hypothetical protein